MRVVVIVLFVICASATSAKEERGIRNWITSEEYLKFDETSQSLYVAGALESLQTSLAAIHTYGTQATHDYSECFTGKSVTQLNAIFVKYLRENPERWSYSNAGNLWIAMNEFCGFESLLP